jgi:hypothetical protein
VAYRNKRDGDRLNAARAAAFNAPRKLHCPWCALAGHGHHILVLSADGTRLHCPQCGAGHEASDDERRLYGTDTRP